MFFNEKRFSTKILNERLKKECILKFVWERQHPNVLVYLLDLHYFFFFFFKITILGKTVMSTKLSLTLTVRLPRDKERANANNQTMV